MRGRWMRITILLAVVGLAVAPTTGLAGPPQPPAAYYGQVIVDGEAGTAGIEIVAYIDGSSRGSITTDANGTFGGPGAFDEKFIVNGSQSDAGASIRFVVAGTTANTTVTWSSGDHQRLTLAVPNMTCVSAAVAGDDNRISLTEIQTAIHWWAEGTEVPNTGEETIGLSKIQELINAWAENTEISC